MTLETLELGYLLVAERPSLRSLAGLLTDDPRIADKALRRSLRAAWLKRDEISDRVKLVGRLQDRLRAELSSSYHA
jgi:hypothetical protein